MKKYFSNAFMYFILIYTVLTVVGAVVGGGALLVEWMFFGDNEETARHVLWFIAGIGAGGGLISAFFWPWPKEEEPEELGEGDWVEYKTYHKLLRNAAQCNHCGDIIESKSVHDWVSCSCFKNEEGNKGIYVDGGLDYCRRGGNLEDYTELEEYDHYRISQFKPKRSTS